MTINGTKLTTARLKLKSLIVPLMVLYSGPGDLHYRGGSKGVDWAASHPPRQVCLIKRKINRRTKTITEATLSPIVPLSFCQVSHPTPPPPLQKPLIRQCPISRGTQRFVSGNICSEGLNRLRFSDLIAVKA